MSSFEEWSNEAEEEFHKRFRRDVKKYKNQLPTNYGDRQFQMFIGYKTFKETRNLVIATWALAVATIVLNILNFYYLFK